MAKKLKITDAALQSWLVEEHVKSDTLSCGELGGFHVRINRDSPKGEVAPASYRVKFRVNGVKQQTLTIAKHRDITLAAARKRAGDMKADGRSGKDRMAERQEAQQQLKAKREAAASKLPTLQEWYDTLHRDRLFERPGKSGKQRINYLEKNWLPSLGSLTVEELSVEAVADVLKGFAGHLKESTADKYHQYLKEAASAYALDNKCNNPLANTKWNQYVRLSRLSWDYNEEEEGSPRTAFSPDQLANIVACIEGLTTKNPTLSFPLALLFMVHTGMRPSDIVSLKWEQVKLVDVDFPHIQKVLLKTRNQKKAPSTIPISPKAVEIIERAKVLSGGVHVFSETRSAKQPATLNNHWWKKVKEETGISVPAYQLRHNMAHTVLRAGGSIADVAAVLGNTVEICIRNYLNDDPRHAAKVLQAVKF